MTPLRRFLLHWPNVLGLLLVALFVAVAVTAPTLAPPDDPTNPSHMKRAGKSTVRIPNPPSEKAVLGTLPGQFDVAYTLVWGTRDALRFGLMVSITTAVVGVLVGAVAGYAGGALGHLMMRVTDAFLAFPVIAAPWILAQVMFTVPGTLVTSDPTTPPPGVQWLVGTGLYDPLLASLILLSWMPHARMTNVNVRVLKQTDFVMAAQAVGVGRVRILLRHILPNAIAPSIVLAARDVGGVVILAATFTYAGVAWGSSDWGWLATVGRDWVIGPGGNLFTYWWVYLPVTITLVLFGIGWNLVGDGVNSALNPRSTR